MKNGASNATTEYFTTSEDDDDDDDISCGKIFTRACNRYHRLEIIMQPRVVRLSIFSRSTSSPRPSSFFLFLPPLPFYFSSIPLSPPLPSRFSMDLHKSTKASNTLYRQEYLIRPREPSPSSLIQNTLMLSLSLSLFRFSRIQRSPSEILIVNFNRKLSSKLFHA